MGCLSGHEAILLLALVTGCGASEVRTEDPQEANSNDSQSQGDQDRVETTVGLECVFDGAREQRMRRDCLSELGPLQGQQDELEQQIAPLGEGLSAPLGAALLSLVTQRRQLCHDWNACALRGEDHLARTDWVTDELASLVRLLSISTVDEAELRRWADELHERRPSGEGMPQQPQQPTANPESLGPEDMARVQAANMQQVRVAVRQQEREIAELNAFVEVVRMLRSKSTPATPSVVPPLCAKVQPTREKLTSLIRGPNSQVGTHSQNLLQEVNDFCGRYERWAQPDERVQGRIDDLFARIERIDGWMNEILACVAGPYEYKCRNAFGAQQPGDKAGAHETRQILKQLRQKLKGVQGGQRRFPCDAPIWNQLRTRQWEESVSKAQMPQLVMGAERVCKTIGLDPESFSQVQERFSGRIDSCENNIASHIQARERALLNLRRYLQ